MKKSLLILGLLAVCGIANAADNTTMNVNAKVVGSALEVETTPVNFGEIAIDARKDAPVSEGKVSVSGDAGRVVKVQIFDTYGGLAGNGGSTVKLTNPNTDSWRALEYTPKFTVNGTQMSAQELQDTGITLDGDGTKDINVAGSLYAPNNVIVGDYSAQMTIKVAYKLH